MVALEVEVQVSTRIAQTFMQFVDWCRAGNLPMEKCEASSDELSAYPSLELRAHNVEILDGYQPINILV